MDLWPEGMYAGAKLTEALFPEGKGGAVEVHIKFDIQGTSKMVYLYTSDAAWPHTEKKLAKLGWNGSTQNPEFSSADNVELNCKVEPYEGKDREKWDFFGESRENAPADKRRVIEARFKSAKKSSAPARPAPAKLSTAPARPSTAPARPSTAPTKPAEVPFSKDECYAVFAAAKKSNDDFFVSIDAVEKELGKVEADFTDADWKMVVATSQIPF